MNEDHHPVGRPSGERGAMTIDRAELRKRAEAATKGEWFMYGEPEVGMRATVFTGTLMGGMRPVWDSPDDEAYIVAAQPSTVLALLDRIEELEGAVRDLLATGLNGGNNMRLAYIAAGGKELSDELLAKAEASEQAVNRARKALLGEKP